MLQFFIGTLLVLSSLFLIALVLIQQGKGGGLAGAFGGAGGQSAFGTKAGDVFTRVTIITALVWIFFCMLAIKLISKPSGSRRTADTNVPAATAPLSPGAPAAGTTPGATTPDTTTPSATTPSTTTPSNTPPSDTKPSEPAASDKGTPPTTPMTPPATPPATPIESSAPAPSTPAPSTPEPTTPATPASPEGK